MGVTLRGSARTWLRNYKYYLSHAAFVLISVESPITISMDRSFVLLSLLSAALFGENLASWTQQYGDAQSTNYVAPTTPVVFQSPWKVDIYPPQAFSVSSAVSDEGVLFHVCTTILWSDETQLVAVSPNGTVLWSKTFYAFEDYVSDVLYSGKFNLVIIALGRPLDSQIMAYIGVWALNATTGESVWEIPLSSQLTYYNAPSKTLSLSENTDSLFYFGSNKSKPFLIFDLNDGSLKKVSQNFPCDQNQGSWGQWLTKITNWKNGADLLLVTFNSTQQLMALSGKNLEQTLWKVDIPTESGPYYSKWGTIVRYAFSKVQGVVYGSASLRIDLGAEEFHYQYYAFGVGISDGALLFNRTGYCDNVTDNTFGISPPVVDDEGYAYYSCGYQVFSIHPDGTLRWKSRPFIYPLVLKRWWLRRTYYPPLVPSLHPKKKLLYTVDFHGDVIYVVSATDGTVVGVTPPLVGIQQPPILVGDSLMYVVVCIGDYDNPYTIIRGLEQ